MQLEEEETQYIILQHDPSGRKLESFRTSIVQKSSDLQMTLHENFQIVITLANFQGK